MTNPTSSDFSFFVPIAKVDKERRQVSGYASTPTLDMDGEIVSLDAVKTALPSYMAWRNIREMHMPSAVGVAKEANVDEVGLFLSAKIIDDEAWKKCVEGVYKGFSIGGRKLAKTGNTISAIELVEISVVDRPANPDCKFEVQKGAKSGESSAAYLVKMRDRRDASEKAIDLMAKAVRTIAKAKRGGTGDGVSDPDPVTIGSNEVTDPPAARDGFSLPAPVKCAAHGVLDCKKCMKAARKARKAAQFQTQVQKLNEFEKRDFSASERRTAAQTGAAMSDGSFPIYNAKDLENAIRLAGHASNPAKAKAHIKSRARSLGLTGNLPDDWGGGSKKLAKRLLKAETILKGLELGGATASSNLLAEPAFLTLKSANVGGRVESGRELDLSARETPQEGGKNSGKVSGIFSKKENRVLKRMGVAGSLAYCFDSIRSAQRSLLLEAKQEGGDMKDNGLAEKLGQLAQGLAAVIGQKAEHEGAEALDMTDADDQGFNSMLEAFAMSAGSGEKGGPKDNSELSKVLANLIKAGSSRQPSRFQHLQIARTNMKKAKKSRKEAAGAIRDAHAMHKAAYLAKAGKSSKAPADGEFDHQGAMEKLQKAYNALESAKTFSKAADIHLQKAASRSGQRGQEVSDPDAGFYEVPPGIKDLSSGEMATAGPGSTTSGTAPYVHDLITPLSGKSAKIPLAMKGYISQEHADALARAAAAEAESAILKNLPVSGGKRPYAFDTTGGTGRLEPSDPTTALLKNAKVVEGVNMRALGSDDETTRTKAVGKMIGNMIVNGVGAKSVFDPKFHGTAGGHPGGG